MVHPIIENTANKDTYMYWWSNIAVDEQEGLRVLTPADSTFVSYYDHTGYVLDSSSLPVMQIKGMDAPVDVSYPERIYRSGDFFYKIAPERKKWVASVDQEGAGLVQFSDNRLQGRKLFIWGRQQGGRHWNEWLSDGYKPYVEIQAGLLKTQLEHFVMDKKSVIQWTEGYCGVNADGAKLHDPDYFSAANYLEAQFENKFTYLEEGCFDLTAQQSPVYYGSGWGAVENVIRDVAISDINNFPEDSISDVQKDWMQLLQKGALPDHDVNEPIVSYVSGTFWKNLLLKNMRENWYDYYQMGVICCADCQFEEAMTYFKRSNELAENPWSLRCMAQIQKNVLNDTKTAAMNMERAVQLKSDYRPLLWDCADALMADGRYADWLAVYETIDKKFQANGRIQFFVAVCLIKLGKLEEARALLTEDLVVDDLQEGEYSISQLWIELYRQILSQDRGVAAEEITDSLVLQEYPLPYKLDFRMH